MTHNVVYWKRILERIRNGHSPFSSVIVGNELIYTNPINRNKNSIPLDSTDDKIIEFFENTVGIQLEMYDIDKWKDIKKKVMKDGYIQYYCSQQKEKYNLSDDVYEKLLSELNFYILLKKINPEDIIMNRLVDGRIYIEKINGLEFEDCKYIFFNKY